MTLSVRADLRTDVTHLLRKFPVDLFWSCLLLMMLCMMYHSRVVTK